ncbi:MAG: hypothetical protein ACPKQO_05380 [Nitrososphaeraceae archaeon]
MDLNIFDEGASSFSSIYLKGQASNQNEPRLEIRNLEINKDPKDKSIKYISKYLADLVTVH